MEGSGAMKRKLSVRAIFEISNGLFLANLGDIVSTLLTALYVPYMLAYPIITDLLPGLASLRGGLMSSMAARISTSLYLGSLRAKTEEVISRELPRVLPLSLLMSIYIFILIYFGGSAPFWKGLAISLLASFFAFSVMFTFTTYFSIFGFKRGINLDNVMAPVITVAGDIITLPFLVYTTAFVYRLRGELEGFLGLTLLWISITSLIYVIRTRRDTRVIIESLPALMLLGLLEAGAGRTFTISAHALKGAGVLQVVPSFLEDTGAVAALTASRMSTDIHLYGSRYVGRSLITYLSEAVLGSLPGYLMLSLIARFAGAVTGLGGSILIITSIVVVGGLLQTILGGLLAYVVTVGSYRFGLDPDNVSIPILTSIMDLTGIIMLFIVSKIFV